MVTARVGASLQTSVLGCNSDFGGLIFFLGSYGR